MDLGEEEKKRFLSNTLRILLRPSHELIPSVSIYFRCAQCSAQCTANDPCWSSEEDDVVLCNECYQNRSTWTFDTVFYCDSPTLIHEATTECSPLTLGSGWYRNRYNSTDLCATHYQQYKEQSASEAVNFQSTLKTWLNISGHPTYGNHVQLRVSNLAGEPRIPDEVLTHFEHFQTAVAHGFCLGPMSFRSLSWIFQQICDNIVCCPHRWLYRVIQFNNRSTHGNREFPTMGAWLPFYYHPLSSATVDELRLEQKLEPSRDLHEILFWHNVEDMSLAIACRVDKQTCVFMKLPAITSIAQLYTKLDTPDGGIEGFLVNLIRTIRFRIDRY